MKTYFRQDYISFLCMLHPGVNQNGWPSVTEPPCMALMCYVMYYSLTIQRASQRFFWCIGSRLLLTSSEINLFPWSLSITHPLCAVMNIPSRSRALRSSQDVRSSYLNKAFWEKGLWFFNCHSHWMNLNIWELLIVDLYVLVCVEFGKRPCFSMTFSTCNWF